MDKLTPGLHQPDGRSLSEKALNSTSVRICGTSHQSNGSMHSRNIHNASLLGIDKHRPYFSVKTLTVNEHHRTERDHEIEKRFFEHNHR